MLEIMDDLHILKHFSFLNKKAGERSEVVLFSRILWPNQLLSALKE